MIMMQECLRIDPRPELACYVHDRRIHRHAKVAIAVSNHAKTRLLEMPAVKGGQALCSQDCVQDSLDPIANHVIES